MKNLLFKILLSLLVVQSSILLAVNEGDETGPRKTISGYVKDKSSGEELIGATVYVKELKAGTTTNLYGFYSLSLTESTYTLVFSYIGYESVEKVVKLTNNVNLTIELEPKTQTMKEVVITEKRGNENIVNTEMSAVKMNMETIKRIPALMGEVDVLKVIQLLPGVQTAGEGASGFSVRGGSTDQNLIILDEATVYNASHLMGFFSIFNNDAIKDVKLYKGDIPAEYGGRLASLLDIRQREGNLKKISGTGGIGTISSRLTLEGPIVKDKCSFLVSGRRSYADLFLPFARNKDVRDNTLYFYDLNTKLNYTINKNNRLFVSGYFGQDIIKAGKKTEPFKMFWGNSTLTVRWNHLFSDKLFSNFSLIHSNYDYGLGLDSKVNGFKWVSNLKDYSLKADMGYYINERNTLKFGAISTYHTFQPGMAKGVGEKTIFNELKVPATQALQHALFVSNEQKLSGIISVNYGLRYSIFQSIGDARVFKFNNKYEVIDTIDYKKGEIYNNYAGFEPRAGINVMLNEFSSIKASYSRTMQYIHLASNSTVGTPLDVWLPSSPNIKPQLGDQVALGYFRNFFNHKLESSIEIYYKKMQNQIDFKDHANLLLNPKIEGELRIGKAYAYGSEILFRKQEGKLTGWIGYTYSHARRIIPEINQGKEYTAPYDKTNNISFVANYEISKQWIFSATWVYYTGAPVTFPTGRFKYGNLIAPVYSDRNSYRMPDYHRLDCSITWEGKKKHNKTWTNSWNLSVYNVYNRHNAFSITFKQDQADKNIIEAYKTYLFPIIPSITYNFKF